MTKLTLPVLISLLICNPCTAQQWIPISEKKLNVPVAIGNLDRLGNIYLSDIRGNIQKFDGSGEFRAQYAPQQYGSLTTLESWASLRVFLFYEDLQQYAFLDRFLNPSEFVRLPLGVFGMVMLATPSSDNQLWLLDSRPMNLVKFDYNFNSVSISQALNQLTDTIDLKPYHMIEYQNRVYLGDREIGILVFDNLGNYLHTLNKTGSQRFYPNREELYYLEDNQLHFISLYSDSHRTVDLPDNGTNYQQVLVMENTIVAISNDRMYIYHYKPR